MVSAEVTELIQGYSIAKTLETTEIELMETVFPRNIVRNDAQIGTRCPMGKQSTIRSGLSFLGQCFRAARCGDLTPPKRSLS